MLRWLVAVGAVCVQLACGGRNHPAADDASAAPTADGGSPTTRAAHDSARTARARTAHVVIVSIDGLRPDAIERFGAPTLERLMRQGRYASRARTILPSTTIPSHTSMLTGVGPLVHHVLWNEDDEGNGPVAVPSVFTYVKREGLTTAAFFSKSKFGRLFPTSALDSVAAPASAEVLWPADLTVAVASHYLTGASPTLLFVHIADTDYAGHAKGWMTPEYGEAVRSADAALAHLLARADTTFGHGGYTLIVTGDHGGHARTHGSPLAADVTIPWIVWGRGVEEGAPLSDVVRTMDTAATALFLLGIEVPRGWAGHAVAGAFVSR